jgi:hypothetical protein
MSFTFRCALIFVDTYAHTLFLEVNSFFRKNRNSFELTDDLGINSDSMPSNNGQKHQPAAIILNHLKVGIEQPDQPGLHNTGTSV